MYVLTCSQAAGQVVAECFVCDFFARLSDSLVVAALLAHGGWRPSVLRLSHERMSEQPDSSSLMGEDGFEPASGPDREFVGATGLRAYARALGPGLITGASDDDPSGIATYAQAGAQSGFAMLWVALLTFPLMMAIQEICDRTALATGKTLGELIAVHFKRGWQIAIGVLIAVLVVANALNIAADLVAIGQGMHLLHAGPSAVWALVAGALITLLLAAGSFLVIARVFKVLCAALLAYVAVLFLVRIPWQTVVVNTVIPHIHLTSAYIGLLVAVLGTTISPYLFFWQAMHRVEEMQEEDLGGDRAMPLRRRSRSERKSKQLMSRLDVFTGMAFSNIVMFAIITATAATLGRTHHVTIDSPAQAASALRPVAASSVKPCSRSASSAPACSPSQCSPAPALPRWQA